MMWVVIALLPTTGFGIYNFGLKALIIILLSVGSAVLAEFVYEKALKKLPNALSNEMEEALKQKQQDIVKRKKIQRKQVLH